VAIERKLIRVAVRPSGRPSLSFRITTSMGGTNVVFLASGPLGTYRWDLDGDGAFDDGRGSELSRTYRRTGNYRVRVRLTDTFGRTATRATRIRVG
ncbi:MAG: PKD domain-containing protein, partial [Solirubrobacterales bacterium]